MECRHKKNETIILNSNIMDISEFHKLYYQKTTLLRQAAKFANK